MGQIDSHNVHYGIIDSAIPIVDDGIPNGMQECAAVVLLEAKETRTIKSSFPGEPTSVRSDRLDVSRSFTYALIITKGVVSPRIHMPQ